VKISEDHDPLLPGVFSSLVSVKHVAGLLSEHHLPIISHILMLMEVGLHESVHLHYSIMAASIVST
jgi:hypothetical protein